MKGRGGGGVPHCLFGTTFYIFGLNFTCVLELTKNVLKLTNILQQNTVTFYFETCRAKGTD